MWRRPLKRNQQLQALKTLGLPYRKTKYVASVEAGLTADATATRDVQKVGQFEVPLNAQALRGSYGMVVPGNDPKSGARVAIKLFNGARKDEARKEAAVYRRLQGADTSFRKHFCTLLHDGQDSPLPFVALSWRGPSLQRILPLEDDLKSLAVISQLKDALVALHQVGVLHTDVKPDNVLFRQLDHRVTLVDFQFAETEGPDGTFEPHSEQYTTYPYRAPEMWRARTRLEVQRALRPALDVWSYGALVMRILLRRALFHGACEKDYQSSIERWAASKTSRDYHFTKAERTSKTLLERLQPMDADFLAHLRTFLHPDPSARRWP